MKQLRQTYEQQAEKFAKAVDISLEILAESDLETEKKNRLIRIANSDKELALNPLPIYKKIGSLKCIEAEFFYYWNEEHGKHIELFWSELAKKGIDYARKDIFQLVLKRNKINNRQEYEYIIDEILVAEQTNRITNKDVMKLNDLLLAYENR